MDLGFAMRGASPLLPKGAVLAPAEHRVLMASLAAMQATCPGAMLAARERGLARPAAARAALAIMLTATTGRSEAAAMLGGSFDPRSAAALVGKARSTLVKARFTFAF